VPYFVENGLPYPTAFWEQSFPKTYLNGTFDLPDHGLQLEVPGCFNKTGDPLENFEGVLTLERRFSVTDNGAPLKRLCIESCFHSAAVWLNREFLGRSDDPYLPFYFDVTSVLRYGEENTLRVDIDNRISAYTLPPKQFEGHRPGWKLYAGIFRDIYIESLPELYCFKADIRTRGAELSCDMLFHNVGSGITHKRHCETISDPHFWNPEDPYLYTFPIRTPFGEQAIRFGLRDIALQGGKLLVNGSPVVIKGVCRHEERFEYGHALPPKVIQQELEMIKGLNANLARLAHYPHSEHTYDLCDELGLYVYTEIANYQAGLGVVQGLFGKSAELRKNKPGLAGVLRLLKSTRQFYDPLYFDRVRRSLIKLIERERCHPSVLFWGVGNECFSITGKGRRVLRELKRTVSELDPSRPAVYAAFTAPGLTPLIERSFKVFDILCLNEYYGWYYGVYRDAEALWQQLARKYPNKPLLLTETGSDSYLCDRESLERQTEMLGAHWALRQNVRTLTGMCVWLLKDFACPEYGDDLPVPRHNCKGLYTKEYREKPAAAALREMYALPPSDNHPGRSG
jgi:beta-glucuronidase